MWNFPYIFLSPFTDPLSQESYRSRTDIGLGHNSPNVSSGDLSALLGASVGVSSSGIGSETQIPTSSVTASDSIISVPSIDFNSLNILGNKISEWFHQGTEVSSVVGVYIVDLSSRLFSFLKNPFRSNSSSPNHVMNITNISNDNSRQIKISLSSITILFLLFLFFKKWIFNKNVSDKRQERGHILYYTARSARRRLRDFFRRRWPEFRFATLPIKKNDQDSYTFSLTQINDNISALYLSNLPSTTVLSDDETTLRIYVQRFLEDIPEEFRTLIHQERYFLYDLRALKLQKIEVCNVKEEDWASTFLNIHIIHSDIVDPSQEMEKPLQAFLSVSSRIRRLFNDSVIIPNLTSNIMKEDIARNFITPSTSTAVGATKDVEFDNKTESLSTITIDSNNPERYGVDLYMEKFEEMNISNDGEVNIEELRDFFASYGYFFTRQELLDFLRDFDLDSSGTINFEEFMNAMKVVEEESLTGSFITDPDSKY